MHTSMKKHRGTAHYIGRGQDLSVWMNTFYSIMFYLPVGKIRIYICIGNIRNYIRIGNIHNYIRIGNIRRTVHNNGIEYIAAAYRRKSSEWN